ncbi:hypothetical protein [Streptomyces narbonensis]
MAAVETSDDEVLDPDTAVKWLEGTAATLSALPTADRRALDGHFRAAAQRHPEGPWREELLRVPEAFGLPEETCAPARAAARATTEAAPGAAHTPAATHAPTLAAACEALARQARRFVATVRAPTPPRPCRPAPAGPSPS